MSSGTVDTVRRQDRKANGTPPRPARRPARRRRRRGGRRLPRRRASRSPGEGGAQDLTHTFTAGFPVFTFDAPRRRTLVTIPAGGFYAQEWTFGEHSGTHMDAPGHFVSGGRLSPEITPQELIVPIVIDIAARAASDPDAMVTADDLIRFERRHGRIPEGSLVCMDSGWAAKVGDPIAFKGAPAFPGYHFPGFSLEAAMWLAEERDVTGIGVDTLSSTRNSSTFPCT